MDFPHASLTGVIIDCIYQVSRELGPGFNERIYQRALAVLLRERGHEVCEEHPIVVHYHGERLATFQVDLIVDRKILTEIKAVVALDDYAESQILNYLKAAGGGVGLLVNFGKSVEIKRRVMGDPNADLTNVSYH